MELNETKELISETLELANQIIKLIGQKSELIVIAAIFSVFQHAIQQMNDAKKKAFIASLRESFDKL